MDIRELRCGDIVTTNGKPMGTKKGDYYQVVEIDNKNKLHDLIGSVAIESVSNKYLGCVGAWVDCLEPIPIAGEILKKMGFNSDNIGEYTNKIGNTLLSIVKLSSCYYLMFKDYSMGNDLLNKPIRYLHQLQHELYDAGIELKIEL